MLSTAELDGWARETLRDPLSKGPLRQTASGNLESNYGRVYGHLPSGVLDLRLLCCAADRTSLKWNEGQQDYEAWYQTADYDFGQEYRNVKEVYADIPLVGRCLDVGGSDGKLRMFLSPGQEYLNIDPQPDVVENIQRRPPRFFDVYPVMHQQMNLICAMAEHLPLDSESFDTVHMRSVLDHFMNPELALREAFRVLRGRGHLIVGLYVIGGKTGAIPRKERVKQVARKKLASLGVKKYHDHHLWHPTYPELCGMIQGCEFSLAHTHWQNDGADGVCYILARKPAGRDES